MTIKNKLIGVSKSLLLFVLIFASAFAFAACGKKSQAPKGSGDEPPIPDVQPSEIEGYAIHLVDRLIVIAKEQGYEWAFGKAHKNNLASSTSLKRKGFEKRMDYDKPVKVESLKQILADNILNEKATKYIKKRLKENKNSEFLQMDYDILMRKL